MIQQIKEIQTNENFRITISRIGQGFNLADEDYDEEYLPASAESVERILHIVYGVGFILGSKFPRALVGPDGQCGFSIEWRKSGKYCDKISSVIILSRNDNLKLLCMSGNTFEVEEGIITPEKVVEKINRYIFNYD